MKSPLLPATSIGTLLLGMLLSSSALAQTPTIFTSGDYRQDSEHWTDPAYYRNNTARELTDMQVANRYGEEGSGADEYDDLTSPYPHTTSMEHYEAWLKAADGGTRHTLETLPDWDGLWEAGSVWFNSRNIQASTIAAVLTPRYREYYVQQLKAEAEGRHWWAESFCLPSGFIGGIQRAGQFFIRPDQSLIISDMHASTQIRWIDTEGSGHSAADLQYPQWMGESIGFWDGEALIIHTNQIRQWNAAHSMFEWSDQLTAVERYERVGDAIQGEVTLYDPVAFIEPLHAKLSYQLESNPEIRPVFSTCTDTNGTSSNIYVTEDGRIDERTPGDPLYWNSTDPRPWATHYAIGEKR